MKDGLAKYFKRLRQGDRSAFLPLYEMTSAGLMRFLLWKTKGDRPLSEDILQESYVRFLTSIDRIQSSEDIALKSYLLQIVRHCLIDKTARTPQVARPHVSVDALFDMSDPHESMRQERAVEMRELQVALDELSEKDSEIIWLRDGLGMSHREVAGEVGISEEASRQAYVRAKRNLLAHLIKPVFGRRKGAVVGAQMS